MYFCYKVEHEEQLDHQATFLLFGSSQIAAAEGHLTEAYPCCKDCLTNVLKNVDSPALIVEITPDLFANVN